MLGKPELDYCLSAGHLLVSAFVFKLQPRYLCAPESVSATSGIQTPFYTCTHSTVSGISHSPSVNARKTLRKFIRVGICAVLSSGTTNMFRLPLYDTPHAVCCNRVKFCVHHRHAARGVCKQRMMALQNYMYRLYYWIYGLF